MIDENEPDTPTMVKVLSRDSAESQISAYKNVPNIGIQS